MSFIRDTKSIETKNTSRDGGIHDGGPCTFKCESVSDHWFSTKRIGYYSTDDDCDWVKALEVLTHCQKPFIVDKLREQPLVSVELTIKDTKMTNEFTRYRAAHLWVEDTIMKAKK